MPLYEYQCSACQGITEVQARSTDAPLMGCSHCGQMGAPLHKLISRISVGHRDGAAADAVAETPAASPAAKHSCSGFCDH